MAAIKISLFFHHIYLCLECVATHVKDATEQSNNNSLGNLFRNWRDRQGGRKRRIEGMHLCQYVLAY